VPLGGRDLTPWGTAPDVHFSKNLIWPFIFRKLRKNKYKKIRPATSSRKPARESYGLWLQAGLMRTHPYLEFQ
jgi:hypothetical protein